MLFLPEIGPSEPRYDITRSYDWNYRNAPALPQKHVVQPADRAWTLAGQTVNSPIAIAAGPLLNGRWVLHYASLGFDVLTYKTVRSKSWPCYPLPNLVPVHYQQGHPGDLYQARQQMEGSWAVSFGMPSTSPDLWRFDVEETRRLLPKQKQLSVSVVASPESDWTLDQLAEDYAKCAFWAREAGADFVELNFSCPNISTQCAQLYLDPPSSRTVVDRVREKIGTTPLLIKIGAVPSEQIANVIDAMRAADGLVMINCVSARVRSTGKDLFDGASRGIAGAAIRDAVRNQVGAFLKEITSQKAKLEIIAVGGISSVEDVEAYLELGASGVQVATSVM